MKRFKEFLAGVLSCILFIAQVPCRAADAGTPYKKLTVPGNVWACDFDLGGEGVSFSPLETERNGLFNYRADAQLNFFQDAQGVYMGINAGNWMQYTVDVTADGDYDVYASYATMISNARFQLSVDGNVVISSALPQTTDWATLLEYQIGTVSLTKGQHVLRYMMSEGGMSFKGLSFLAPNQGMDEKNGAYRKYYLPALIPAENFNYGRDGAGSLDGKNNFRKYRPDAAVDIGETESGNYYVLLNSGDYVSYTFDAEQENDFAVSVISQGTGTLRAYIDGVGAVSFPVESADQYAENQGFLVRLPKGEHTLKLISQSEQLRLDSVRIRTSDEPAKTISQLVSETKQDEEKDDPVVCEFYLSPDGDDQADGSQKHPFRSFERAKEAVRNAEADGSIAVNLLAGEYTLTEPVTFTAEDGGKNGHKVIWRGEAVRPVISGGTRISGWREEENGIWSAAAPVEEMRTLYIDGVPAERASSKYLYSAMAAFTNDGSSYASDGFYVSARNFPEFSHPEELETVWPLQWTLQRLPVSGLEKTDKKTVRVAMKQPYYDYAVTKEFDGTNPGPGKIKFFYLENARELLDEPGEFYFDKREKRVYYYPYQAQDLASAKVYAGTCEGMIRVEGTEENKVESLVFENLEFRYGAWNEASQTGVDIVQDDKMTSAHADIVLTKGKMIAAQLEVNHADGLEIRGCRFSDLGSIALGLFENVTNATVCGNVFTDISASAISVGHWDQKNNANAVRCKNIDITNNVIRRTGVEYAGSDAVKLYYTKNVRVQHNDIEDISYSGISVGWGWGIEDILDAGQNLIADNRIVDVMKTTKDGGHIYTLGQNRDTVISGNYLSKSGEQYGGVYNDQGSSYMRVVGNVIEKCGNWLFSGNADQKFISAENNFADTDKVFKTDNVTITGTTVVTDGNWPEEARKIIRNAGLEQEYKKLLQNTDLPEWVIRNERNCVPDGTYLEKRKPALTVQAEDYKPGGEGIGYHKEKQEGTGIYRQDAVSIFQGGSGYVIGNTCPGEWLEYDFNIEEAGRYEIGMQFSNARTEAEGDPIVNLYIDCERVTKEKRVLNCGDWDAYFTEIMGKAELSKGAHTLRLDFVNNGFSFDYWTLRAADEPENEPEFDEGVIVSEAQLRGFSDILGHWSEKIVQDLAKKGLIKGKTDSIFAPEDALKRSEAARLILRVIGKEETDENIQKLIADQGNEEITREEFIHLLMTGYLWGHKTYEITLHETPFPDFSESDELYREEILGAYKLGLILGDENSLLHPKKNLTRAEACAALYKLLGK